MTMKVITEEDIRILAYLIERNIKDDFSAKKLSENLVESIKVEEGEDGKTRIKIPALAYDMGLYLEKGVIVHNGRGSYAAKVNEEGGSIFGRKTGNHVGFIEKAIGRAVTEWEGMISHKAEITGRKEQ